MSRTKHHRNQGSSHAGHDYGGRYKHNKRYCGGYGKDGRDAADKERRETSKKLCKDGVEDLGWDNGEIEMSRYYVDERSGCVAVRDKLKVNEDDQGLHSDMPCVVAYWMGFKDKDNNGIVCWNVHNWQLKKANDLVELLNKTQSA